MSNDKDDLVGLEDARCFFYNFKSKIVDHPILSFRLEHAKDFFIKISCYFKPRTYSIAIVFFFAAFGVKLFFEETDVFGFYKNLNHYTGVIIDKVSAPFYQSKAQDEIVVVLINDSTLERQGTAWPPHYSWYSHLLTTLFKHKPKAVFFDVYLDNYRSDDKTLDNARASLQAGIEKYKTPLVLAQAFESRKANVFEHISGVSFAMTSWQGYGNAYPLMVGDHENSEHAEETCHIENTKPSAALALYNIACSNGENYCKESAKKLSNQALCTPLITHWGKSVANSVTDTKSQAPQSLVDNSQCDLVNPSDWDRVFSSAKSFWHAIIYGISDKDRQKCAYSKILYAHDLLENNENIGELLKGKIVLVGTQIPALNDYVTSPVHGQLPGVFVHAMALDNLIQYGSNYFRHASHVFSFAVMSVLGFVLCFITAASLKARDDYKHPMTHGIMLRMLVFLISIVVVVFYFNMHYQALNWLSILLLFELANHIGHASGHLEKPHP